MVEEIKCMYAKDWTKQGTLYKCKAYGHLECMGNYGGVKFCKPLLNINVEARAEQRAKQALDELLDDDPRDVRAEHMTFIDDYEIMY